MNLNSCARLFRGGAAVLTLLASIGCDAAGRELGRQAPAIAQTPATAQPQTIDKEALGWLPSGTAKRLTNASVPVLVPKDRAILSNAQVVVEPAFYSLSSNTDGATVSFHATTVAHRAPTFDKLRTKHTVRGVPALLTDNEGIKSVTWFENGTSFALDVECARSEDRRCSSADYVLSLANRMAYVGGAPVVRAPVRNP